MMEAQIDTEKTRFHGKGYDEAIDRERLMNQLKRVASILSDGREYDSQTLCNLAGVSFAAMRNRVSDLRVYHGHIIESKRVKDGLWGYRFVREMTPEEFRAYHLDLRRGEPIGNEELWGKMWQAINAYASVADIVKLADLSKCSEDWAKDMAHKLWIEKKSV